jgi:hypothetical protein
MPILLAFAAILPLLAGCGDRRRQEIRGTVTFDGTPLAEGQLRVVPLPGTSGPTAGASIKDGEFHIAQSGGAFAGTFRVEITARRPSNKLEYDPESGRMVKGFEQYIPARYNSQSTLTAEVKPGEANEFDFPLTSAPGKGQ